ncbi:M48 family metalloprotease [Marinicella sediminis]|uniref:M48 family metalloprotease n=1 Tax=Marinicella sediminis TaxID=1792834 RepID=A0ABV7JC04_9GAMM|nr:M48 family metallopeptidase [Marinicella sediminis]
MRQTATERRNHFRRIAEQAQRKHQHDPAGYLRQLRTLAWLGYGYLMLILCCCLGVLGGLIYLSIQSTAFLLLLIKSKFIVVVLVVMYVIIRSLMVRIPPPEGVRVSRGEAPVLFATIDDMQKTLKTATIHEVVITPELNAAIQQTPRLGVFGWQKNSLILGIELLMFMSVDQAKAVIGHELGHLSGGHARFNGWIYRLRISWMNILYVVSQTNGVARWVFGVFFNWYAPYFNAYSFSLARANEFEADQIAVKLTSAQDLSEGLVGMHVVADDFFNSFFKQVEREAIANPNLTPEVYVRLKEALSQHHFRPEEVQRVITRSLKIKTSYEDTHPALKDRIAAVDGQPRFRSLSSQSAAAQWFGDGYTGLLRQTAEAWFAWHGPQLKALHEQAKEARLRQSSLSAKANLNEEDLLELGHIHLFLREKKLALQQFKKVYQNNPQNPHALYQLGAALLERQQAKGTVLLEQLMAHEDFAQAAGALLYAWYETHDQTELARQVQIKMEHHRDLEADFHAEVSTLSRRDVFGPVTLTEDQQLQLRDSLKKYRGITHVWLAAKKLQTRPDVRLLVILYELERGEDDASVFSDGEHPVAYDGYFTLVNLAEKKLSKKIRPHCFQLY